MSLAALFTVLIALFYILKILTTAEFASVVLAVISIMFTLMYQECRHLLGIDSPEAPFSEQSFSVPVRTRKSYWFQYLDLSFLVIAITLIGIVIFDSFVLTVEDLVKGGFMTFNREKDGFIHLQTYLGGFVLMPLLLAILAGYGFLKGFKERVSSFPRLLVSITIGTVLTLCFLYMFRGGSPAIANYDLLAEANPGAMPIGARPLALFNAFGMSVLFDVCLAGYAWIFALIGRIIRTVTDKLNSFRNV